MSGERGAEKPGSGVRGSARSAHFAADHASFFADAIFAICAPMLATLVVSLALGAARAETPAASVEGASVLVLFSEDASQPATQAFEGGLQDSIGIAGAAAPVLYFEYLDAARFEDRRYRDALRRFIRDKYSDRTIDLVVPVGQSAIEFLAEAHADHWLDAPALFVATHQMTIDGADTLPGAAGIEFRFDFAAALPPAIALLPGTQYVALISGDSALERARVDGAAATIREAGLEPIELTGLTLQAIVTRVAGLPPHTAVFVAGPLMDASRQATPVRTICSTISAASNSPAFMVAATQLIGCGVVGGRMRDFGAMGRLAGHRLLATLHDFSTAVEAVPASQFTSLVFDARQLRRWNLDERRLPAGSIVQFRTPSVWRDYQGEVLLVAGGLAVQFLLILGLLYERRQRTNAQLESRRNLALAAHVDRRVAMTTLTGSIAHELAQPLGSILHNAQAADRLIATNRATTDVLREILGDIRREDARATQIVERHRTMLRKHELQRQPLDLYAVIRESLALIAHDAAERQIAIEEHLPTTPCIVDGDQVLLQQVVVNLVMNAMDALAGTPPAQRRVVVSNGNGPDGVQIAVCDSGPGLPGALDGKLFEPFVTTKADGLGIGLSIVRGIVEAHGGVIDARNQTNGGAVFRFTLPYHAA